MKYLLMFGWVGVLWGQPTFVDPHYTADLVYAGDGMTAIDFASTGQLLAIEKKGRVLIFQPNGSGGFFAPTVFADLTSQVNWSGEAGLLGLAVDPDFASTRHVFLFYSTDDDQRITRLTSNPGFTAMEPGSELVLLSGLPRTANFHKAGELRFHPLDPETLFCSTGDDGEGIGTSGGIPLVQHPDFYHGKILRISKDNGQGVSSNPFWDGDPTSIRSRVWAVGFRNPFRFTFYPGAPIPDLLYSSENGDSTDRCSWVLMGSNGAWSASGDSGGFLNPPDPNHHVMQTLPRSVLGIAIADSGPFAPGGPTLYWANWLSGIRRYHLTGANLDTLTAIPEDSGQVFTDDIVGTDLEFGPDGNLYAAWSNGDDSTGGFFTIRRIRFSGVDPPVAAFSTTPNPATGPAPLMVSFTDSSSAPGSNIASRLWDFGDGASSSATNPSHTYTEPGIYTARLTVTNDEGLVDSVSQTVTAYRTVTVTLGGTVFDARTLPASPLASANELRFYQISGEPIAFTGGTGPNGNALAIANGTLSGAVALNLTGDGFLVSAGEPTGDGLESATVGVEVGSGQTTISPNLQIYLSDRMIRGRTLDFAGIGVSVDLGTSFNGASNWIPVGGGRDYLMGSGIPSSGILHRRTSDPLGYFHIAIPSAQGNGTYYLNVVADTQADTFASRGLNQAMGSLWQVDIQLARFAGGSGCDDLSGISPTPNVDFASQIQPILTANCVSCHHPTATNSGGLDLTSGQAESQLVNQPSSFALGLKRVQPGQPEASFLFEKVNCAQPQVGTRMRPTNAMALTDQALIRDWIVQLDLSCLLNLQQNYPFWPSMDMLDLVPLTCP